MSANYKRFINKLYRKEGCSNIDYTGNNSKTISDPVNFAVKEYLPPVHHELLYIYKIESLANIAAFVDEDAGEDDDEED